MTNHIVLTGGGTAGHVTPNIALIEALKPLNWTIDYIGSAEGVEHDMISALNIPFYAIRTGKLRRYFSWKNFLDPINIIVGVLQAYFILRKLKAQVVFSKGGFVAFPVVVGAWLNRIPVVVHESDITPGLANRLSFPFAKIICLTFLEGKKYFNDPKKLVITGTPIREALFKGNIEKGLALCGFSYDKPRLLVIGGSLGAAAINHCVRNTLDVLCQSFQVIHLCGKGKVEPRLFDHADYYQFEYVNEELADLLAASDVIVSRAGANSLYELLALKKPHVLVPLSKKSSRGDQIENARHFKSEGISVVVEEEQLTSETLLAAVQQAILNREEIIFKITSLEIKSATTQIVTLLTGLSQQTIDIE